MERKEYFSQEKKDIEKSIADKLEVVRDPVVWRNTYDKVAEEAWKRHDIKLLDFV